MDDRKPGKNAARYENKKSPVYIGDDKLIPRIKQYIQKKSNVESIDADELVDYLRSAYRDYARKKLGAFRNSVIRAYDWLQSDAVEAAGNNKDDHVIESSSKKRRKRKNPEDEDGGNLSDASFSSQNSAYMEYQDSNTINKAVSALYKQGLPSGGSGASTPRRPGTDTPDWSMSHAMSVDDKLKGLGFIDKGPGLANKKGTKVTPGLKAKVTLDTPKCIDTPEGSAKNVKNSRSAAATPAASAKKSSSKSSKAITPQISTVKLCDIGGCEKVLEEVSEFAYHIMHPEILQTLGDDAPPRGFLLHGPPGCGKTHLAHCIAGELDLPLFKLASTEVVSGVSGESEETLRKLFSTAIDSAPCILFIDEIDAIAQKRENASKEMERRIVSQLLSCLDDLSKTKCPLLVIGATNCPDSLDPALRRAGRFDKEICLGMPDVTARERICRVLCKGLRLGEDFSFPSVAQNTPGFVGADLLALKQKALMNAAKRTFTNICKKPDESTDTPNTLIDWTWLKESPTVTPEELDTLYVTQQDFQTATLQIQPSAKREGFATVPDVTWSSVGALQAIREELQLKILAPIRYSEQFSCLGIKHNSGVLLAGPPGCGKTLLAKAIANESGINFLSVKGPELLNMYVGESERAVRQVFQRARNSAPCVVFFDELDALCPRRSSGPGDSGSQARVVNQLLTEMDGVEERNQVFVMGATNRPDIIDPAILRPGRLDKTLFVGFPNAADRLDIILKLTKNGSKPKCVGVNFEELCSSKECEHFTGADLNLLVREASFCALRECIASVNKDPSIVLYSHHFTAALSKISPSVSAKDRLKYENMKKSLEDG